jgi:hypothetical protein
MLFSRAFASAVLAWLTLPAGSRLSPAPLSAETGTLILPRRSRLFTAAILLATTLLLFLPESREALSTVLASWNGYRGSASDLRALQKIAARAEKEKDARTLAFVSLVAPDPEGAAGLADHAAALDPGLAWIYASRRPRPEYHPPPKDGLARLVAADSDNAFPEILAAQAICEPRLHALVAQHSLTPQETEAVLAANSDWVTHMDRAFRAPRYDSYFDRRWQLTQEVWNHNPDLSVSLIFNSIWSHPLLDFLSIKSYANILVQQAHQAASAGHPGQAESLLREVDSFGRRVADQGGLDLEKFLGLDVSRHATSELRDFYQRLGRMDESQEATRRLQLIEGRVDGLTHSLRRMDQPRLHALERSALWVQICAILALLSAGIAAICLVALEWRPGRFTGQRVWFRRVVCVAADWVPTALLIASMGLL